jgi:hypothetical protein
VTSEKIAGSANAILQLETGANRVEVGPNIWDFTGSPNFADAILIVTSTAGAQVNVIGNTGRAYNRALRVTSAFVGEFSAKGNKMYSYDANSGVATDVVDIQPGNGAVVDMANNEWTGSAGTDSYRLGSAASTAQYRLSNERTTLQLFIDADVSGTVVVDSCKFQSSTAAAINKNGTELRDTDFAVAPTLTGTGLFTKGCTVAGSAVSSPAALASGASALTLPVTDYVRLDPDAANSSLSGMTARAGGVEVFTVNVDAGAATLTYTNNSGVTEANEYLTDTGADFVDSANKTRAWWYDSTTAKWRNK